MTNPAVLEKAFSMQPCFSLAQARRVLSGASAGYARLLLHNLVKGGRLHRVARGVYSFHSEAQVAGFAFSPFYYGLQDALSLHGAWEQETNPVVVTVRKVREGVRSFEGANFVVRCIPRRLFFGFESMQYGDLWVPVSSLEKTLADLAYFRCHVPADALREIRPRVDLKELDEVLSRFPKPAASRAREMLSE
ncbi:MAG: type IV toxin-antitoxin system AbiEi family antitoxin domain-containing protein [Candidatus Micrarchaeota archaeon]